MMLYADGCPDPGGTDSHPLQEREHVWLYYDLRTGTQGEGSAEIPGALLWFVQVIEGEVREHGADDPEL